MWGKADFCGIVAQAQAMVSGFKEGYRKFEQQVVLRLSKGLLTNYGRNVAHLALHFGPCPESVSVEEINSYLYHKEVDEKVCENYMKHTVFGVRMWQQEGMCGYLHSPRFQSQMLSLLRQRRDACHHEFWSKCASFS